jgi:drug/metabolite transporter (DMT)-like permease
MMMGLKTFPASVVRISMGMAPIVGVLLAWIILKEKTQCFDIFSIFVGIFASLLIILS